MDHRQIIEALGGPSRVAKALGCSHSQPVRWQRIGIPPRRWREIATLAQAAGLQVTVDVIAAAGAASFTDLRQAP